MKKSFSKTNNLSSKKTSKTSSYERIKSWRQPFYKTKVLDLNGINQKISAKDKYDQMRDLLMFNYFDQTALGGFIKTKALQIPKTSIHQNNYNQETPKIAKQQKNNEQCSENQQIIKLQKMALGINNFEQKSKENTSYEKKLIITQNAIQQDDFKADFLNKKSLTQGKKRVKKNQRNKTSKQNRSDILKIPIVQLIRKQGSNQNECYQKKKQLKRLQNLKKQISMLEKQAAQTCGLKFTKIKTPSMSQNQSQNRLIQFDQNIELQNIESEKTVSFQNFQTRLSKNFPNLRKQDQQCTKIDSTVPISFLNILKNSSRGYGKSQIAKLVKNNSLNRPKTQVYLRI